MEADHNVPSAKRVEARLAQWNFDTPGAPLTFVGRLARENGWSLHQAARVLEEYRRFLLLAVSAGHPVCPSDAVDQAWHQHLLDSRAYWEVFCPQVLGQPLHHSPSKGSVEEGARLREAYQRTLASYEAAFGARPPTDIWPSGQERFRCGTRWQRLETSRCWILPRPRLGGIAEAFRLGWPGRAVLAFVGLVAGCGGAIASTGAVFPLSLSGPEFLLLYGVLAWLSMALVRMGYDLLAREPGQRLTSADNLSPLQMAFLVGGEQRSVATAMLGLVLNGRVEPVGNAFRRRAADSTTTITTTTTADTPLERALLGALNGVSKFGKPLLIEVARERELFVPLRRSLEEQGLIRSEAALARGRVWATVVLGGLWWLGMVRLGQGLEAGRPLGFLILCLLAVTFGWLTVVLSPPRQTQRGEVMGRQLSRDATFNDGANQPPEHQLSTFAVLGWVSLPTSLALSLDVAGLQTVQSLPPSSGGGGDAGGGCGGGGCGGGGCGCGGCGG